jgi:hypothetical protein
LVSIGTGEPGVFPFGEKFYEVFDTLKRMATETDETANSFAENHAEDLDENTYFRFNVTHGLQQVGLEEAEKKKLIADVTGNYIRSFRTINEIRKCQAKLKEKESWS